MVFLIIIKKEIFKFNKLKEIKTCTIIQTTTYLSVNKY